MAQIEGRVARVYRCGPQRHFKDIDGEDCGEVRLFPVMEPKEEEEVALGKKERPTRLLLQFPLKDKDRYQPNSLHELAALPSEDISCC